MEGVVRAARRAAMVFVASASAGFGLLLIWMLVRPGVIAQVATVEMVVVLGLFLLPVATLAAWFMDHRAIAEQPAVTEPATPGATPVEPPAPVRIGGRHEAAPREDEVRPGAGARRHRRVAGAADRR